MGFIKTHSLETLYNRVKHKFPMPIQHELLILLDQLYIDSRYPGELGLLPNGKPSLEEAKEFAQLGEQVLAAAKLVCT